MRIASPTKNSIVRPRSNLLLPATMSLLILPLLLCACGGSITHPTGEAEVVVRIESGGGFVPVEYNLTQSPGFTLYGDGTVIVTGPMIEIYPQPALPNLQTATISPADIDKILVAAKEAGLFTNGIDYGQPGVADVPTTTITIAAEGQTYVSSIYALSFEQMPDNGPIAGLTAEQTSARAKITDFTFKTGDLDSFLSTNLQWQQYEFDSLAVFSQVYDPTTGQYPEDIQPNRLDWPLGDLATLGETAMPEGYRRVVVSGDDLAKLRPLLDQATRITLWESGGREYHLYFRPLLPDEMD